MDYIAEVTDNMAQGIYCTIHQMFIVCSRMWDTKFVTMFYVSALCSILIASCLGSERLPDNRILNATETSNEQIPYQVAIEISHGHLCSGSIIKPSWVLTVANCVHNLNSIDLTVRVDAVMRGVMGKSYNVQSIISHPEYNHRNMDYDIALLEINGTSTHVVDIATDVPYDGLTAKISGWGSPSSGEWLSAQLSEKEVTIVYFNDCKYLYENIGNPVTERMLCASSTRGGPCQGDTGDPLVYEDKLIGMMSWSYGCGEGKFPAVYTDVTKLRAWINGTIGL